MLLIIFILAIVTYFIGRMYAQVRKLPPGPIPLPCIGNLHQMVWGVILYGTAVGVMRKWQEKYGNVYTWWLGPLPTVNICDYQAAYDAMVKTGSSFVRRPYIFLVYVIREFRGIAFSNGNIWQEQRRFSLHTLRNFGLGRNVMEDRVMLEFEYRSDILHKQIADANGTLNFDPQNFLELTVGNIINRMLFAERICDGKEAEFFKVKRVMDEMFENTNVFDLMINDWVKSIPPFKQRVSMFSNSIEGVLVFIKEQIRQRISDIEEGKHVLSDNGDDFVDAFLIEMEKEGKGESFDEGNLAITLLDLWIAGQETTTTSMYWAIIYLVLHPEVKHRLQDELDDVTGRQRQIQLSDKTNTPYLNAVISETFRLSAILNLNLWREATEDVNVGGYIIPKGTAITAQLSLIMSDPKHFENPEKFNPDRFLNSDIDQFVVPFGIGKRSCIGESLARSELYLLVGNLFLKYDFETDENNLASMDPSSSIGAVRRARPYHVNISMRA